jgi:hypothetical protein
MKLLIAKVKLLIGGICRLRRVGGKIGYSACLSEQEWRIVAFINKDKLLTARQKIL